MTHAHTSTTAPVLLPFPGDEIMAMDPGALTRLWTPSRHALPPVIGTEPRADYDGDDEDDYEDDGSVYLDNGVAVVCVDGPLMQRGGWWWDGYASIHSRMLSAFTRPGTRALGARINSPGGVAAGCFEAARQMRADCIAAGVPVIVYADEMACSAAYALACVGDPSGSHRQVASVAWASSPPTSTRPPRSGTWGCATCSPRPARTRLTATRPRPLPPRSRRG